MEFLAILGLFVFISMLLPWIQRGTIANLKDDIEQLREEVKILQGNAPRITSKPKRIVYETGPVPSYEQQLRLHQQQITEPVKEREAAAEPEQPEENQFYKEAVVANAPKQKPAEPAYSEPRSMEFNFGAKLPVWIGAISLIFASFFLMKYSVEAGWLSPMIRTIIGGLFGTSLLAAGQIVLDRPAIANYVRIAQGLCGAGIVILYVCLYASVNLYHFISPATAFAGMAIVTALAVIMSLRMGQPIAAFGLLGGLLTPALVGSAEPNSTVLFVYLFVLFAGMMAITASRGWWILSALSLLGVFGWTAIWAVNDFNPADSFQMVLLQVAVSALVLSGTRKFLLDNGVDRDTAVSAHALNMFALGGTAVSVMFLSFAMPLTFFNWGILGLISVALIALTFFKPDIYRPALWIKMFLDLTLFFIWADHAPLADATLVLAGLLAIYGALLHVLTRVQGNTSLWSAQQITALIMIYGCVYFRMDIPQHFVDTGFWGITSLILAAYCAYQARYFALHLFDDENIQNENRTVYAWGATAFIAAGLVMELPQEYWPLAFALQALATVWVFTKSGLPALDKIALVLTVAFVGLCYREIGAFTEIIGDSIFKSHSSKPVKYLIDLDILQTFATPALLFGGALYLRKKEGPDNSILLHIFYGTAFSLVLASIYCFTRQMFTPDQIPYDGASGFIERGIITFIIGALGLLALFFSKGSAYRLWGIALLHVAAARLAYFDLFLLNPYLSREQMVGGLPLLNGITMTYLGGFAAITYILRSKILDKGIGVKAYSLLALSLLLAFVSLSVRYHFHGQNLHALSGIENTELYTYSIVWLLTSIALFAYGVYKDNKEIRLASLCVMTLSICKVFLIDAAELEGLYRVFSFFGLGISLIGISYFYTRFVANKKEISENA